MIVTSIEYCRHEVHEITPHFSVAYDIFTVTADDLSMAVYMELSNQPESALKSIIADAIRRKFGSKCDNIDKVYQMVMKVWPGRKDHSVIQMY